MAPFRGWELFRVVLWEGPLGLLYWWVCAYTENLRSCTGDLIKLHIVQLLITRVPILVVTYSAYKPAMYLPQYILPLMQNIHVLGYTTSSIWNLNEENFVLICCGLCTPWVISQSCMPYNLMLTGGILASWGHLSNGDGAVVLDCDGSAMECGNKNGLEKYTSYQIQGQHSYCNSMISLYTVVSWKSAHPLLLAQFPV